MEHPQSGMTTLPVSGAPTALAVIDTVADIGTSIYNTNRTIKANKEMAKYAYSKDLEMWRLQNEYNSPASQMARFKEAGLNPLLMYGQGSSGNATQLPKYQVPKLDYSYSFRPNLLDNIQKFQDISIKQNQNNILEEQVRRMKADADLMELKRDEMSWRLPWIKNFGSWDFLAKQQKYSMIESQSKGQEFKNYMQRDLFSQQKQKLALEIQALRIKNKWANYGLSNPGNMLLGVAGSLLLGKGIGSVIGRASSGIGKSKLQYAPGGSRYRRSNNDIYPNLNF